VSAASGGVRHIGAAKDASLATTFREKAKAMGKNIDSRQASMQLNTNDAG
jgi:hypothetical protein